MKYKDFFKDIIAEVHLDYEKVPVGDEGVDWFIAGNKPIVLIDKGSASGKYDELVKHIKKNNLPYTEFQGLAGANKPLQFAAGQKGMEPDLQKLKTAYIDAKKHGTDEKFHRTVGTLLGYSQKDINTFIDRLRAYQKAKVA
jgi:hypothetical protein